MPPMRRRPTLLLFAVVAAMLIGVSSAGAACIKRNEVRIASGTSPNGWNWTVDGAIRGIGDCQFWLFGMYFDLEGTTGSASGALIPPGGHLDRSFDINASDDLLEDGSYRVFSGMVNGEVAKVLITLSNNKHVAIRPKSPPEHLRRKVVWLRNVRYFVEYYRPEAFVTGVATFSASGQLLYRDKSFEGF
jgi:hypothetical protein